MGFSMQRFLVAFERPSTEVLDLDVELKAWDEWVDDLRDRGLQLVADLDPVEVTASGIEIYEAVSL